MTFTPTPVIARITIPPLRIDVCGARSLLPKSEYRCVGYKDGEWRGVNDVDISTIVQLMALAKQHPKGAVNGGLIGRGHL